VGEHDAGARDDVDLRLDGLVTAARGERARGDAGARERVVEQHGRAALVRADPGLAGEVGAAQAVAPGEPVTGREQHPRRVGEQPDELDLGGRRLGGVDVLEHDGRVEVARADPRERPGAVDELVLDVDLRQPRIGERDDLGRQLGERGEERPEADASAAQPGELRQLLLREGEAALDVRRVGGQQPAGLRGPDAPARAAQQRHADLRLQQRHLPGDRRLRERQPPGRGGERSRLDHRAQRGELPGVEHVAVLGTRHDVQSFPLNGSARS
jgi:hypothetical protein